MVKASKSICKFIWCKLPKQEHKHVYHIKNEGMCEFNSVGEKTGKFEPFGQVSKGNQFVPITLT